MLRNLDAQLTKPKPTDSVYTTVCDTTISFLVVEISECMVTNSWTDYREGCFSMPRENCDDVHRCETCLTYL